MAVEDGIFELLDFQSEYKAGNEIDKQNIGWDGSPPRDHHMPAPQL